MSRFRQYKQPFSSRDRTRIKDRAREIVEQEIDQPGFKKMRTDQARRAYLRMRVRERLEQSKEYGNPLVSWLMWWAIGKIIDLAIAIWLKRRNENNEGGIGHA